MLIIILNNQAKVLHGYYCANYNDTSYNDMSSEHEVNAFSMLFGGRRGKLAQNAVYFHIFLCIVPLTRQVLLLG